MTFKPFKAPSFRALPAIERDNINYSATSSSKRRKLSPEPESDSNPVIKLSTVPAKPSNVKRRPLHDLTNNSSPEDPVGTSDGNKSYYAILWRKPTNKKNKIWDDDGVLSFSNGLVCLYDNKGHRLGSAARDRVPEIGTVLSIGGKEVELEDNISKADFLRVVNHTLAYSTIEADRVGRGDSQRQTYSGGPKESFKLVAKREEHARQELRHETPPIQKITLPAQPPKPLQSAFKQPLKENTVLPQGISEQPVPRHDPSAPNALVFRRPRANVTNKQIVDVVLDPLLGKRLREHQRQGVMFLYECVMDLRKFGGQGCILADDMGLGKTLQTISLIWTLVKQNPIYKAEPVVKKVLIVCPVTLVQNWRKEFYKWLGRDKLGVMTFDDQSTGGRLSMFDGRNYKVMIVGYERLQKIAEDLTRGAGIDLIICDEGHRLKTLKNKSVKAIDTLNTPRRIILSGTPIQNDLTEFYAMVNFVNDGILGSFKAFTRDFEKPIMRSRQPDATEEDVEQGQKASDELSGTTSPFILRRTADVLSQYLPPKTEYVLFCKPTEDQARVYREVLRTPMFAQALGSSETAFQMITVLKKLCNSPVLMRPPTGSEEGQSSNSITVLSEMLPRGLSRSFTNSHSSKIRLLAELLYQIRKTTNDKVVLVSNYTATLDLMENLLLTSAMTFKRLDGSVPNTKRQAMIDEFNKCSPMACFAFLLSAKAGGVGINLIGANRLVLFDVDWNPATDEQAMARIHRDGQKKPCAIYRFLIKGGIEERIWQRQVVKRGLADSIMEGSAHASAKDKAPFSRDELKDLFRLDEREGLQTHDLIGCQCLGQAEQKMSSVDLIKDEETVCDIDDIEHEVNKDATPRGFSFTRASQMTDQDFAEQEQSISSGSSPRKANSTMSKKELKMQELMTYTHLDTTGIPSMVHAFNDTDRLAAIESIVADPCLMHVLRQSKDDIAGSIDFIFMKRSREGLDIEDDIDDHVGLEQRSCKT